MAEVAALAVLFGVPVVRKLDLGVLVAGRGEKDQRKAPLLAVVTLQFHEPELVAVKIERLVDIADAHHRVQVLHEFIPVAVVY